MKKCTHCGKELFDQAVICPGCGCPAPKVCQYCGKEIASEAVVCINCGCPVTSKSAPAPQTAQVPTPQTQPVQTTVTPAPKVVKKPEYPNFKRNLDAIIYTVLTAISFICWGIHGYFYEWVDYGNTDYYWESGSTWDCIAYDFGKGDDGSIMLMISLIVVAVLLVVLSWLEFGMKRPFSSAKIICSAALLIAFPGSAILGAINNVGYYEFSSFGVPFFVQIGVLVGAVVLSILNLRGTYLIKLKDKKEATAV